MRPHHRIIVLLSQPTPPHTSLDPQTHLPEITTRSLGGGRLTQKWGYSFPEIVDAAAASCRALLPESKKVTFVGHDWGWVQ